MKENTVICLFHLIIYYLDISGEPIHILTAVHSDFNVWITEICWNEVWIFWDGVKWFYLFCYASEISVWFPSLCSPKISPFHPSLFPRHDDHSHGQSWGGAGGWEIHTEGVGGRYFHQDSLIQGWEATQGCLCCQGWWHLLVSNEALGIYGSSGL